MTSWTSQSQLTSYQSLYSTSAGGWGEIGGGVVGVAVLLAVGVAVALFVGGHDGLASLAETLSLDSVSVLGLAGSFTGALASAFADSFTEILASDFADSLTGVLDSLSGALSLVSALASAFAASLTGALSLDSALASDFASFAGALASVVAEVELGDSSAPAGTTPSRRMKNATKAAITPRFVISLLRDKSSC